MTTELDKTAQAMAAFRLAAAYGEQYIASIATRRVTPDSQALALLDKFANTLPQLGYAPTEVIRQLHQYASPATVGTTGGRYFGLVVGGATPASMAASVLAAAWDQIAIMEAAAPSAIYLERLAGQWLLQLLGLPQHCSVGFTTGTSVSNLVCLSAARNALYQRMGIDLAQVGLSGAPPLQVLVSEQAHVTVFKALGMLGFGKNQIKKLPCDSQGRIEPSALRIANAQTIVCLQAGNVNSGACDDFSTILPALKATGAWCHVDGAFGLWAAASSQTAHLTAGVELADSWATDAHKWLNTPYDCGVAICRTPEAVHQVMTTQAPYLTANVAVPPKDMVPEFSRRARGVEVWAAISEMGQHGISDLINRCCGYARQLATGLTALGYEVLNDVVLNQVVATIGSAEDVLQICQLVQQEGVCWFGTTQWQGKTAIRLSVASWRTESHDIELTVNAIARATAQVLKR